MSALYVALVHHPIRDREGRTVTTAITNLDVHDLARSCRTFGVAGYFVVSPIAAQRAIVDRILEHWSTGPGKRRVPERGDALSLCRPIDSVDAVIDSIATTTGQAPLLVATSARPHATRGIRFEELRVELAASQRPILLVFGTGHGLADAMLDRVDRVLEPVLGVADYNHLSVRSAAAIILDRLTARERLVTA